MPKCVLKLLIAVLVAGTGIYLVWFLSAPNQPAATPSMPNPNGYDDFVNAGQMLTRKTGSNRGLSDYCEMSTEELRMLVLTNAEALKLVRTGLKRECRMPIQYSEDSFRAHMGEGSSFISLAFAFCAAGRLAQLEGHTNDAVTVYLDMARFAHESIRGGLIIDSSLGRTCEALGMESLQKMRDSLDAPQCRRVAKTLEEVNARRQPWHEFVKQHAAYYRRAYGWLSAQLDFLFSSESRRIRKHFEVKFYEADQRRRQLTIAFAVHAYELEKGQRPKSLADLVPAYVKAIPQDPFTGTNIVYTP